MLAPVLAARSSVPIVTVPEAKLHCGVIRNDHDELLNGLIKAAVSYLDGYSGILGRALLAQTWQQDFSGFSNLMRLPVGDLISVDSVQYYDSDNAQQTLSGNVYQALTDKCGPLLVLNVGQYWPSTCSRQDAVRVTWRAGFGSVASDVPPPIKEAILLLIGHWYRNREAVVLDGSASDLPLGVSALVQNFRRRRF